MNKAYIYKDILKLGINEEFNFSHFNPIKSNKNVDIYIKKTKKNLMKFIAISLSIILNYFLKSFGYWTYENNKV